VLPQWLESRAWMSRRRSRSILLVLKRVNHS
jgi:hypothetical protein